MIADAYSKGFRIWHDVNWKILALHLKLYIVFIMIALGTIVSNSFQTMETNVKLNYSLILNVVASLFFSDRQIKKLDTIKSDEWRSRLSVMRCCFNVW